MSASKINPFKDQSGRECSGGFFGKNNKPTSASSPDYTGRFYLVGSGWHWLSGWAKQSRNGEYIKLLVREMTDDQAAKHCKPAPANRPSAPPQKPNGGGGSETQNEAFPDIPF